MIGVISYILHNPVAAAAGFFDIEACFVHPKLLEALSPAVSTLNRVPNAKP